MFKMHRILNIQRSLLTAYCEHVLIHRACLLLFLCANEEINPFRFGSGFFFPPCSCHLLQRDMVSKHSVRMLSKAREKKKKKTRKRKWQCWLSSGCANCIVWITSTCRCYAAVQKLRKKSALGLTNQRSLQLRGAFEGKSAVFGKLEIVVVL